jgi:tRNA pseudouridine38-40 synthase
LDPEPNEQTNYRLTVAYDGRDFYGWQRLKDKPTVQAALEAAVEAAFTERVPVRGAGRTDRGAHAEGQVAGVRLSGAIPPEEVVERLGKALPPSIRVLSADVVPDSFHVRTDATSKDYEYRILNRPELPPELDRRVWHVPEPLDLAAMQTSIEALVGRHDFASFATRPRFEQRSTTCTIASAEVESVDDRVVFRFTADRFLMHMVRNIARAIAKVGEGRYQPSQIAEILAARSRAASPGSAPASGLYLMRVYYRSCG